MFSYNKPGDASDCLCTTDKHNSVANLHIKRDGTPEKGRDLSRSKKALVEVI